MNHDDLPIRKCILCKEVKQPQAFVGAREICRLCWLYVPACDRPKYSLNEKLLKARRKRKLLKRKLFPNL